MIFSFLVLACSKNDDEPDNGNPGDGETLPNIAELAESVNLLEDLVAALGQADAGLIEALSAEGQNTVFAPTNDAFGELLGQLEGFDSLDDFDEDSEKELLAEILKYHVVAGETLSSADLSNGTVLSTLQSEDLVIDIDVNVHVVDKTGEPAEVVSADNEASNGVVHIIDKVLLPQAVLDVLFPKPNLVELVVENENLSLLEEAVVKANLVDALSVEGPLTIFAPTNAAIEDLFVQLGDDFTSFDDFDNFLEIQLLERILLYHVVEGNIKSGDLAPGTVPTLFMDNTIEVIASGETFVIGDATDVDANIEMADLEASNGTVHIIDKILVPQAVVDLLNMNGGGATGESTIKELVEENEELSFLREALELTGLLDTLGEEGPFTVFAPSNDALFGLLGLIDGELDGLDDFDTEAEIDLLRDVLLYHVLPGITRSTDLVEGPLSTLSGDNTLEVIAYEGALALEDATGLPAGFELVDIPAENGVVHVIDRILVPESVLEDILDGSKRILMDFIATLDVDDIRTAMMLLARAEDFLEEELDEEFTFFLPSNQAFLDLFDALEDYDSLADFNTEEDLVLLATILSYHFIEGQTLLSGDLSGEATVATLQGEDLVIGANGGVTIMDKTDTLANVTSADAKVLNGVVHIIDKVLLPQEVLDAL